VVVAMCALLSARQTRVWRNSETLFRHMVSVLGHDPYRAEILWRLGDVLAPQGRIAEAKAAYEESVRVDPNSASAYNGLGELLAQQGQWREALSYFSRALDRQPGFLRALNNIAWTLATAGDANVRNGRQALDLAQALNERSGIRNAQFLETLAAAYAEIGQFERAVAAAEQIPAMAKLSGEFEVAARNEKLLPLYRAGQPYRQGQEH
jgi:tetratricopeptide (TPR) repeat protein